MSQMVSYFSCADPCNLPSFMAGPNQCTSYSPDNPLVPCDGIASPGGTCSVSLGQADGIVVIYRNGLPIAQTYNNNPENPGKFEANLLAFAEKK